MGQDQNFEFYGQSLPDVWASYWKGLNAYTQGAEPIFKSAARCNLEFLSFGSRRARAYLEVPAAIARCRSPQDLAGEQMRFWQTAAQDYADAGRRVMDAWNSVLSAGMRAAESAVDDRDYITFAEPRADEGSPAMRKGTRRAA